MLTTAFPTIGAVRPPKKIGFPVLLFGVTVLLTACVSVLPPLDDTPTSPGTPAPDATATLFVTVQASALSTEPSGFRPPETARVTLEKMRSGSNQVPKLQREAVVQPGPMVFEFERIEAGGWTITAELLNDDGVPMYTGKGEAYVQHQETTSVQLTLDIVPGSLEVHIDLGESCIAIGDPGVCLADVANRGHVKLEPNVDNHAFEWTPGDTSATTTVTRLIPGDYEFQVVFYKEQRTAGNILYESRWMPFRIEPGHTTTVFWQPETGALHVSIRLPEPPPPAPTDLIASWTEDGVLLTWTGTTSPDISHYNVWHKKELTERMEIAHTTGGGGETTWLDETATPELCGPGPFQRLAYTISAVSESGRESLRSNEVDACALLP